MSLIFVFLDGVGLAPSGPDNPLTTAPTPALRELLGGPLTIEQERAHRRAGGEPSDSRLDPAASVASAVEGAVLLKAIDATLGMPGLPQSGTGQTALLAGFNAAALHGRHQPHFPPVALRPLLAERSILRRVVRRGGRATFANAFGPGYWEALAARRIRRSASVIATEGAGLGFRTMDDLRRGAAISWDITGERLRGRPEDVAPIAAARAGANLARLAGDHDLVFFECFLPDLAGHGRMVSEERRATSGESGGARPSADGQIDEVLATIDGLLGGLLEVMRPTDTLLLTSDHGNVEDATTGGHTRNPVPLLAVGPGATSFAGVTDIAEVADVVEQIAQ